MGNSLLPTIDPEQSEEYNRNLELLNSKLAEKFGMELVSFQRDFLRGIFSYDLSLIAKDRYNKEEAFFVNLLSIRLDLFEAESRKIDQVFFNAFNFINSLRASECRFCFAIRGTGFKIELFMGIIPQRRLGVDAKEIFLSNIRGCYSRSSFSPVDVMKHVSLKQSLENKYAGFVTGIPVIQNENKFVNYNISNLIEGMLGKDYAIFILAEPYKCDYLGCIRDINTMMQNNSLYIKQQISESKNLQNIFNSLQVGGSLGMAGGISSGVNLGMNFGLSGGFNQSVTYGLFAGVPPFGGVHTSLTTGFNIGANLGINAGVNAGANVGVNAGVNVTAGRSDSRSRQLTLECINHPVEYYQKVLELHRSRAETMNYQGGWETAIFLLAEDMVAMKSLDSLFTSVFTGNMISPEPIRVNAVRRNRDDAIDKLELPENSFSDLELTHPLPTMFPRPFTTVLSSEELSAFCLPSTRSFSGFEVAEVPDFSLNSVNIQSEDVITLGKMCHGDQVVENYKCQIDLKELTKHILIAGITGSGKTNTCFHLLMELNKRKIPFLVIEPVKSEYRQLLVKHVKNLKVYTAANEAVAPLRLNPLALIPGVPLQTQIDSIKMVINASFPMYGPMPYIMEHCLINVYEKKGWNVTEGKSRLENPIFPTLEDLKLEIEDYVSELGYSQEVTMNIKTALETRINSLMRGGKGMMFNTLSTLNIEEILHTPTIIELKDIGDDDDKIFFMGLLLIRLYQYFSSKRNPLANTLNHFLLVEEAHRLFRNVPITGGSFETVSIKNKAVEYFSNILSEVRAYGLGVGIVDQIPARLSPDCIKNTGTKIIHRLISQDDKEHIGLSIGLKDKEINYISSMREGRAIFYTENLMKPVIIKMPHVKEEMHYVEDDELARIMKIDAGTGSKLSKIAGLGVQSTFIAVARKFIRVLLFEPSSIIGSYPEILDQLITAYPDADIKDSERKSYYLSILLSSCREYLASTGYVENRYRTLLDSVLEGLTSKIAFSDSPLNLLDEEEFTGRLDEFKSIYLNNINRFLSLNMIKIPASEYSLYMGEAALITNDIIYSKNSISALYERIGEDTPEELKDRPLKVFFEYIINNKVRELADFINVTVVSSPFDLGSYLTNKTIKKLTVAIYICILHYLKTPEKEKNHLVVEFQKLVHDEGTFDNDQRTYSA